MESSAHAVRSTLAAGAVLLAVALLSRLRIEPGWLQVLATCALLIAAGVLLARGRPPTLVPPGRASGVALPLALGVLPALACWPLLAGPLDVPERAARPWSGEAALLVAAVPIAEELFFRGTLLRVVPRRPVLAIALSSAAFGLLHLPLGPLQAVAMTLAGASLAGLVLATGGVTPAIAAHAAFNGLAVGYREQQPGYLALAAALSIALALAGARGNRR